MKNRRVCPKCSGNDILMFSGYSGAYGSGNNIPIGFTVFSAIPVDRYVCGRCGFSEEWIREEDLEKLRNSYKTTKL